MQQGPGFCKKKKLSSWEEFVYALILMGGKRTHREKSQKKYIPDYPNHVMKGNEPPVGEKNCRRYKTLQIVQNFPKL
jgi:hypothetical protein